MSCFSSSSPEVYGDLHDAVAIVLCLDGFEQLAYSPLRVHLISKLFDSRGGQFSININKL